MPAGLYVYLALQEYLSIVYFAESLPRPIRVMPR